MIIYILSHISNIKYLKFQIGCTFIKNIFLTKKYGLVQQAARVGYYIGKLDSDFAKYSSDYDTLFYLIRKKIYSPYYPQTKYGKELWIDKNNFSHSPKGTGCMFIARDLFLESLPNSLSKDTSDDTKIMKNIVFKKNIKLLRHTDVKAIYHQRITNNIYSWIHHRGRIWADHYLSFINVYSIFYTIFRNKS